MLFLAQNAPGGEGRGKEEEKGRRGRREGREGEGREGRKDGKGGKGKGERRDGKGPQFTKNDPPPVIRWLVTGLVRSYMKLKFEFIRSTMLCRCCHLATADVLD